MPPWLDGVFATTLGYAKVLHMNTGKGGKPTIHIGVWYVYADQLNTPRVIAREGDQAIVWRWGQYRAVRRGAGERQPEEARDVHLQPAFPGPVFRQP